MTKILYIGNKLEHKNGTPTTISTLGKLLEIDHRLYYASHFSNKLLRMLHMLYAVIRYRRKVDVVLIDTYSTTNFHYAYWVSKCCKAFKLPYIPILHGGDLPKRLKQNPKMSESIFKNAFVNVAPSLYMKDQFRSFGYDNIKYIPNNIEISNYAFLQRENYRPKLLWVRSFAKIYNPNLAIDVLKSLKSNGHEASLCMIGPEKDGSLQEAKEYAKTLGVEIRFTGMLSKAQWHQLSKDYDIFINTTNFDNMPVSVIEAMALGLPVVSTNVGGLPLLLKHGEDAMLVDPNNAEAFCEAIEALIKNKEETKHLVLNARKKAETFDWNLIKDEWYKLLDDVA